MADDLPQLTPVQLLERGAFEWWYFDTEAEDGTKLVAAFGRNPPISRQHTSLYVEYFPPGGARQYTRNWVFPDDHLARETLGDGTTVLALDRANRLSLRPNPDGTIAAWDLKLCAGKLAADLTFVPTVPGFKPSADGRFLWHQDDNRRYTAAVFAAPSMTTTGHIRFCGRETRVIGHGYHDHPWGTEFLTRACREWHWGRLLTPSQSIMYIDLHPETGFCGGLRFYSDHHHVLDSFTMQHAAWRRDRLGGLRFPHETTIETEQGLRHTIVATRSLENHPIYNRSDATIRSVYGGREWQGRGWTEYFKIPRHFPKSAIDTMLWLRLATQRLRASRERGGYATAPSRG